MLITQDVVLLNLSFQRLLICEVHNKPFERLTVQLLWCESVVRIGASGDEVAVVLELAGGFSRSYGDIWAAWGGSGEGGLQGQIERREAREGNGCVEGREVIIQRWEDGRFGRTDSGKAFSGVTASGLGGVDTGHVAGVYWYGCQYSQKTG